MRGVRIVLKDVRKAAKDVAPTKADVAIATTGEETVLRRTPRLNGLPVILSEVEGS
jgi:hypothetical protein